MYWMIIITIRLEQKHSKSRTFYYPQLDEKIGSNKNRNKYFILTKNGLPEIILRSYADT